MHIRAIQSKNLEVPRAGKRRVLKDFEIPFMSAYSVVYPKCDEKDARTFPSSASVDRTGPPSVSLSLMRCWKCGDGFSFEC